MSFTNFLNHKCDVYHIIKNDMSPGYNLPGAPDFSYPETPDITDLICHFNIKNGAGNVAQKEPQSVYANRRKLTVSWGTDIRLNDKIVEKATGYEYTAEQPMPVQTHHIYVMLRRTNSQEIIGDV